MKIAPAAETNHQELLTLLNPLLDFMDKKGYSFFIAAGKDGVCTRHLKGQYEDIEGMIIGMMKKNKQIDSMITEIVNSKP